MMGYFIEYSKTKARYRVILGDTPVTSLHVWLMMSLSQRGLQTTSVSSMKRW